MEDYSIFRETIVDMTWLEVEKAAEQGSVMLVPAGVIEQHGPHLPLGTDIYAAHHMCSLVKNELSSRDIFSVIAPPYYFGINVSTGMFPGSITIKADTMTKILTELLVNYKKHGFGKQLILSHHGDADHIIAIIRAVLSARDQDVDALMINFNFLKYAL